MKSQHGTATTKRTGLRVSILSSVHANQVSFDHLTLVGEGIPEIFPVTEDAPGVEILPHHAGPQYGTVAVLVDGSDSPAAFVVPSFNGGGGPNWAMATGLYITSTDSRFPESRPVPLHNRYEVNV